MKLFVVLPIFAIGVVGLAQARPQDEVEARYGRPNNGNQQRPTRRPDFQAPAPDPGSGCRTEYQTKYEIQEVEKTERKCEQWTENKCTTKQRRECKPYVDRQCETKYRQKCRNWTDKKCEDTWRNDCQTKTKKECNQYNRPKQVPYTEDECRTEKERRCDQHWEEPEPGRKVWVDNPATCKDYDKTECRPVQKFRTEIERYTQCKDVPYQDCNRVKDTNCFDVPQQECNNEPWEDCRNVQRENCNNVPWQDCQDYPREKCRDVHTKVPKQVAVQVPVRVCGNRNSGGNHQSADGSGVFDVRQDQTQQKGEFEEDYSSSEEDYSDESDAENIDVGLFGQSNLPAGTKKATDASEVSFAFGDK